jgi:hypothetical protein
MWVFRWSCRGYMWQGTVVGTVVRASMLINCDLGPSLCCSRSNGGDADQHIMLLGHRRYLASTLRACVTIWKSYPACNPTCGVLTLPFFRSCALARHYRYLTQRLCEGGNLQVTCASRAREQNARLCIHIHATRIICTVSLSAGRYERRRRR